MKSLKLAAALAPIALAIASLTSPTLAHASPDDGVKCPAGFSAQFNGTALKCVRATTIDLTNDTGKECVADAPFSNFQKMSRNQRDICVHQDSNIPSNAELAEFENGQVLIRIPVGRPLPRNLQGRTPVRVVNGIQFFRINENADFIFYDRSRTINQEAATKRLAVERLAERQLNVQSDQVESKLAGITTTQTDFSGSLDKIEGRVEVFTFAKP